MAKAGRLRDMTLVALMIACAALCGDQAPAVPAAPSPPEPPVSVERIQERLQRSPALQIPPELKPDYRASVTEKYTPPETILEAVRRELAGDDRGKRIIPGAIAPPLIAVDLLQIAMAVKRSVSAALRARAERNARDEVAAALAEFCASHDCEVLEQGLDGSKPEGVLIH